MTLDLPTAHPSTAPAPIPSSAGPAWRLPALLASLAGAVAVRVGVAGAAGVHSAPAGLVFAVLLVAITVAAVPPQPPSVPDLLRQVPAGLAGAAVLCLVPLVVHLRTPGPALPLAGLPVWAAVVTLVAVAEEVLLRGALWTAAQEQHGTTVAVVVTTLAFGLLHVPLYGRGALPLDLAVGLLLAGVRMAAGGWVAPAVAHTVADLAGWWLR